MRAHRDGKFRRLVKAMRAQGWRVEITGGCHYRFVPPDPLQPMVHTGSSPSDHRSVRNLEAQLRRAGLVLP